MGHRALIAYERPDETYNLHYSHWGGLNLRLRHAITKTTPFGEREPENTWTERIYEHLQTASDPELPDVDDDERPWTDVDPEPLELRLSLEEILSTHLNYATHEAFYVVQESFAVEAYRTFWLGFDDVADDAEAMPSIGHGVICPVRWYEGKPVNDGYLRGWFDGTKAVIGAFIDRGVFSTTQATTYLLERLFLKVEERDSEIQRADLR